MRHLLLPALFLSLTASAAGPLGTVDDGQALTLRNGDADVLSFRYAPMPPPAGQSPLYVRGGFIHPLRTPSGQILTAIHPADHIHHLGVWNPWTSTTYDGRHVDYWNLKDGQGTVRFVKFEDVKKGPEEAGFTALLDFVDLKAPGGELVTLHERQTVLTAPTPADLPAGFLVRFTSEQWCATDKPFHIVQYRYGGFGFRARMDWNKTNSDYLTDSGKTRANGNSTTARWCRIQGTVDGRTCGALFLGHPANFNAPEPIRIWPATDHNGMVFFNFAPAQNRDWVLEPGKQYVRRYGIFTYDGEITAEQAEAVWKQFSR